MELANNRRSLFHQNSAIAELNRSVACRNVQEIRTMLQRHLLSKEQAIGRMRGCILENDRKGEQALADALGMAPKKRMEHVVDMGFRLLAIAERKKDEGDAGLAIEINGRLSDIAWAREVGALKTVIAQQNLDLLDNHRKK